MEPGRAHLRLPLSRISVLAHRVAPTLQPEGRETVLSLLGRTVFGHNTPMYFVLQVSTAAILTLAANTAKSSAQGTQSCKAILSPCTQSTERANISCPAKAKTRRHQRPRARLHRMNWRRMAKTDIADRLKAKG